MGFSPLAGAGSLPGGGISLVLSRTAKARAPCLALVLRLAGWSTGFGAPGPRPPRGRAPPRSPVYSPAHGRDPSGGGDRAAAAVAGVAGAGLPRADGGAARGGGGGDVAEAGSSAGAAGGRGAADGDGTAGRFAGCALAPTAFPRRGVRRRRGEPRERRGSIGAHARGREGARALGAPASGRAARARGTGRAGARAPRLHHGRHALPRGLRALAALWRGPPRLGHGTRARRRAHA